MLYYDPYSGVTHTEEEYEAQLKIFEEEDLEWATTHHKELLEKLTTRQALDRLQHTISLMGQELGRNKFTEIMDKLRP